MVLKFIVDIQQKKQGLLAGRVNHSQTLEALEEQLGLLGA